MFYVYVIQSEKDNRLYKGLTTNLELRLYQHNSGQNKSTKAYCPWRLLLKEVFSTREEARMREKFLKPGIGREYLKERFKK